MLGDKRCFPIKRNLFTGIPIIIRNQIRRLKMTIQSEFSYLLIINMSRFTYFGDVCEFERQNMYEFRGGIQIDNRANKNSKMKAKNSLLNSIRLAYFLWKIFYFILICVQTNRELELRYIILKTNQFPSVK